MNEHHGFDDDRAVYFYEHDFYVLSNFSAFTLVRYNIRFDTLEHCYHWEKFNYNHPTKNADLAVVREMIRVAPSAHDAYYVAQRYKSLYRPDWSDQYDDEVTVKEQIMFELMMLKTKQHAYVLKKLLATGDRLIVEDSWRDDFWGWGPNKDGHNGAGKCWMRVRSKIKENLNQFQYHT